jgi:hypothetical protein
MFSVNVKRAGIGPLPSEIPLDEILLEFTAITPYGTQKAWVPDTILGHFLASNPDGPIIPGKTQILQS